MARIRTIKPEFFRHEALQDLEIEHPGKYPMLVFEGLWGHCDSKGRFEWRPRQLKLDILPFLPFDMADTLDILEQSGQVERYVVDGKEYGVIPSFERHQRITGKEAIDGEKYPSINCESAGKQQGNTGDEPVAQEGKGKGKEGNGVNQAPDEPAQGAVPFGLDLLAWDRWAKYRHDIRKPIKPVSILAAQRKLAGFGTGQAEAVEQSIANGWQGLFEPKARDGPRGRARQSAVENYAAQAAQARGEHGKPTDERIIEGTATVVAG